MYDRTVTTARAAEIVGVGYEGLRSYLKRGLGGRAGMMPKFQSPKMPADADPAPRAGWTRFGAADLCVFRLAKQLMDAGFNFENAKAVASHQELWLSFARDEGPGNRLMAVWPPYDEYILDEAENFERLKAGLGRGWEIMTIINLGMIHSYVRREIARGERESS